MMAKLIIATITMVLMMATCVIASDDMFCNGEDCYKVLEIEPDASKSQIKRAFYKQSLRYHPDKNSSPGAEERFRQVANAYDILYNDETRKTYDYVREHPEEWMANQYRYYSYKYAQKTDSRYVIGGFLLFITVSHWLYWNHRYDIMYKQVRYQPTVLRAMKDAVRPMVKKEVASRWKRPTKRQEREVEEAYLAKEDVHDYVKLEGWQGRKPTWKDILPFILCSVVWSVFELIYWWLRWAVLFNILGREYGDEEKSYITGVVTLGMQWKDWMKLDEDKRQELIERKLWIRQNFIDWKKDMVAAKQR